MDSETLRVIDKLEIRRLIPSGLQSQSKSLLRWGLLGLIVRLIVMPLMGHPDAMIVARIGLTLGSKQQLIPSVDPPLVFLFYSAYLKLIGPVLPSAVVGVLTDPTQYSPEGLRIAFAMNQTGLGLFLFLLKIPLLLLDFVAAVALLWIPSQPSKGLAAYKLWMLNPVSLLVTFAVGQYDIFAVSLFLVGLALLRRERYMSSALVFGLAGAFKLVGILFLLPLAIYTIRHLGGSKGMIKGFSVLTVGLLTAGVGLSAALLTPKFYQSANLALPLTYVDGFYQNTLYTQGATGNSILNGLFRFVVGYSASLSTPGSNDVFVLMPMSYAILLFAVATFQDWNRVSLAYAFMGFLFSYYALSLFLPQWFLWVQPLLLLWVADKAVGAKLTYIVSTAFFFVYTLKWDPGFTTNLLAPIDPKYLGMTGPYQWLMQAGLPPEQIVWAGRAVLSASLLFGIALLAQHLSRMKELHS